VQVLPFPEIDKPFAFELTSIGGTRLSADDLRGKVVLIDCWATWCTPCMAKMSALKKLYERNRERGLEIIGVNFDQKVEKARDASAQRGLSWPIVHVPDSTYPLTSAHSGSVLLISVRDLWYRASTIRTVPRLLLVDRRGVLRADCSPHELEEKTEKLLAEGGPTTAPSLETKTEADFRMETRIPAALQAGTPEQPALVAFRSVRFDHVKDRLTAQVRGTLQTAAETRWQIRLELFDEQQTVLGQSDAVFATHAFNAALAANQGLNAQTRDQPTMRFEHLPAAEYRVSAVRALSDPHPDPTPFGVSEIIRLGPDQAETVARITLGGTATLRVRLSDADTGAPLGEEAEVRLSRQDNFLIGADRFTDAQGEARYAALEPGEYGVVAVAVTRGQQPTEYRTSQPVRVVVPAGDDRVLPVALRAEPLAPAEVDRRWPWCVRGTFTDGDGRPMPSVDVVAHCGIGTLRATDRTRSGPDGRYTLRFTPGVLFRVEDTDTWGAGTQAATITAQRTGFYEANLGRQGNLAMTDADEAEPRTSWPGAAGVVLPGRPYTVDFVMLPAAIVEGQLMDGTGRPLPNETVWVSGAVLPPSSSVLTSVRIDAAGRFRVELPCRAWWFELRQKEKTAPVEFNSPGEYRVELIYDPARSTPFTARLVSTPRK